MLLFKSYFKKDLVILFVITILLSSVLSLVIGYASDYYFGDAINSLIGDYENNDLLLIIDQQRREVTIEQIEEVIAEKIPGSELITGISLVGKSNSFIALADKYKNRETFLELENYFKKIKGVTTTSIMTEPRLTIDGVKTETKKLLRNKIGQLKNVDFTFPNGDKLEVIVSKPQFSGQVKEEVNDILEQYQTLNLRFPIDNQRDDLFALGEKLESKVSSDFEVAASNITETKSSDMDSLVKTMNQMKGFLSSYATEVKIELFENKSLKAGDELVMPAKNDGQLHLRVSSVNDMIATAVVTVGDSRQILDNLAYKIDSTTQTEAIGSVEINNPRQDLAYLVTELNKLVPQLNHLFTDANSLINNLEELFSSFDLLDTALEDVESLNHKLASYTQNIEKIDGQVLKSDLNSLEQRLAQLRFVIEKLELMREMILSFEEELADIKSQVTVAKQEFSPESMYYNNLEELKITVSNLSKELESNTDGIIDYINQYNPLLTEIKAWQQRVQEIKVVSQQLIVEDKTELATNLEEITNSNLIAEIKENRSANLEQKLERIKNQLDELKTIDFAEITKEIEYIQRSLPKLKDEEITSSIDLLDNYLAGKVIPGGEVSLLLPATDLDFKKVKQEIRAIVDEEINFQSSAPGAIVPNLRSQIYQILSEVKILLTAITALLCTVLSLLFDQGLIISSLQELNSDKSWYRNIAFYYSLAAGILTFGGIIYLTGVDSYYLPWWLILFLGTCLGLLVFKEAKAITGVSWDEFRAGEALGFNYGEIMQEIIIPAGKPGILKFLNQRKTYF
ncbi:MAG: hypothetical protein ACQEP9_01245 [Bacillota bacterium]